MAVIKYQRGSVTTVLSTEMNGMANGNKVLSAAIDNTTDLNLFEDLVLSTNTFSSAPDSGAIVSVFLIEALGRVAGALRLIFTGQYAVPSGAEEVSS